MHGNTIEMQNFSKRMGWRRPEPLSSGASRDRSLPGKKRIRARKAARRALPSAA